MKYKIVGVLCCIAVLVLCIYANGVENEKISTRYHQHKMARQPSEDCQCNDTELCTHLPIVIIDTKGQAIPGEIFRDAKTNVKNFTLTEDGEKMIETGITIIDNKDSNNHITDEATIKSKALIRIRGNSSRAYNKKGYLVRFIDEDGSNKKYPVMGMDSHYEWALHGPYLDKTLIRNYMWYNIAGEIMDYAPNTRFCEVILDGKYIGLYVMVETITGGEDGRLNLGTPHVGFKNTGYLLRLDRGSDTPQKNIETFTAYSLRDPNKIDIRYPRNKYLSDEIIDFIKNDFSNFEKTLYSYDYDTEEYGYWNYIDTQSFVDYFIINEITQNYDAGNLSTFIYKAINEKYKMVIWDFNSACDNYRKPICQQGEFVMHQCVWYYMLMKDDYFCDKIIQRYYELRKTFLSDEYLNAYIDETVEYLGDAIDRNYQVWNETFDMNLITPRDRNPKTYEEAVNQMKTYLKERTEFLDEHIEIIRQYGHESKVKKFNH